MLAVMLRDFWGWVRREDTASSWFFLRTHALQPWTTTEEFWYPEAAWRDNGQRPHGDRERYPKRFSCSRFRVFPTQCQACEWSIFQATQMPAIICLWPYEKPKPEPFSQVTSNFWLTETVRNNKWLLLYKATKFGVIWYIATDIQNIPWLPHRHLVKEFRAY